MSLQLQVCPELPCHSIILHITYVTTHAVTATSSIAHVKGLQKLQSKNRGQFFLNRLLCLD
jgi:hypothetical protein